MRKTRKRDSAREKNKKNSARFLVNERYFHLFLQAKHPPRFQIISFSKQKGEGAKIAPPPTLLRRLVNSRKPSRERSCFFTNEG